MVQFVESGTGDEFGWINLSKPLVSQNRSKTEKTGLNRQKSFEPKIGADFVKLSISKKFIKLTIFNFFIINFNMSISILKIHSQSQKKKS